LFFPVIRPEYVASKAGRPNESVNKALITVVNVIFNGINFSLYAGGAPGGYIYQEIKKIDCCFQLQLFAEG